MSLLDNSSSFLRGLESYLNLIVLRLFPVWYTSQLARTMELKPLGSLNKLSFQSHKWLSLHSVLQGLSQSLPMDPQWQVLNKTLSKLVSEVEYNRRIHIKGIHGVEHYLGEQDWPTLIAYAEDNSADIEITNAEEFEEMVNQTFTDDNKRHQFVFREWDGRCYWKNPEEPNKLAALLRYAHLNERDAEVQAKVRVESINSKALDRLRNSWWLLLLNREDALRIMALVEQTKMPIIMADFEWRRNDLAFLVARKDNRRINQIFLNLIDKRSTKEVLEFGSYLGRNYHPFQNQSKTG